MPIPYRLFADDKRPMPSFANHAGALRQCRTCAFIPRWRASVARNALCPANGQRTAAWTSGRLSSCQRTRQFDRLEARIWQRWQSFVRVL